MQDISYAVPLQQTLFISSLIYMTAANSTDFQAYLESICSDEKYLGWQDFYTPTDALHRQRIEKKQPPRRLNLSLMVQTIVPRRETEALGEEKAEKEKVELLEVLKGLRDNADNHVLLVGKPGSGKSTALERLLWEEAEKAKTQPPEKIPVLVELRRYKTSVLGIIGDFLFQHRCRLNEGEIEQLLLVGRFLLLVDGWNELPDEEARKDVKIFREKYQRFTPMIFTTRELAGDIGIEKKLEMQPLTEEQMRQFVLTYLPEEGERLLQQLEGRLRELGETPLLLWMLCEVFDPITGNIPPNLGLVFRCFAQSYDSQIKQDVSTDESRSRWFLLLQHLAFEMMRGKTATDLRVTIPKQEAEDILTGFLTVNQFEKPRKRAFNWLNDLLKYHLIQLTNSNREIEFHHQLLQEYYAAERLLVQLPKLSDDTLKRDYLNYLKWTEPLALMLALVEDEEQALRVVKLALEVDLQLGARLAGEVKLEFQERTFDLVAQLNLPQHFKMHFFGKTRSNKAISHISQALEYQEAEICRKAIEALTEIGTEAVIPILHRALKDKTCAFWAIDALGKIGTDAVVPILNQALGHEDFRVCFGCVGALSKIGSEAAILNLCQALKHQHSLVRSQAARALGKIVINKIDSNVAIAALLQSLEHDDSVVRFLAAYALWKSGSDVITVEQVRNLRSETTDYLQFDNKIPMEKWPLIFNDDNQNKEDEPVYINEEVGVSHIYKLENAIVIVMNSPEVVILKLMQTLEEPNSEVNLNNLKTLGKLGTPEEINPLYKYFKRRGDSNILNTIFYIQKRNQYYNYEIYTSPAPEKQKPENTIIDRLNEINQTLKTMSETPKYDFSKATFNNVGSVTGNIQGDVNNSGTQHNYAPKQNLAESAAEIQQLFEQLAKNNPTIVQSDDPDVVVSAIHEEIKRNFDIKRQLLKALKAGGTEALKVALDTIFKNPAVSISVETIKGFIEAE